MNANTFFLFLFFFQKFLVYLHFRLFFNLFCPIWLSLSKYDDNFPKLPYLDF